MAKWRTRLPAFALGCSVGAGVSLGMAVPILDARHQEAAERAEAERQKVAAELLRTEKLANEYRRDIEKYEYLMLGESRRTPPQKK